MSEAIQVRSALLRLLSLLRPQAVVGRRKTRVGRANDGGYVMIDAFEGVRHAYSFGIKDDVSWDHDVADRGIEVFQYDHTIDALPETHERFRWQKTGLGALPNASMGLETLDRLLRANGHERDTDLLLKCDIEGAEWSVIACAQAETLSRFSQIVIEFHNLQNMRLAVFGDIAQKAISNITQSHALVHVHGNNCGPWMIQGGIPLPVTLEMTFARRGDFSFVENEEFFPGPLDMPNNAQESDYFLGQFRFPHPAA